VDRVPEDSGDQGNKVGRHGSSLGGGGGPPRRRAERERIVIPAERRSVDVTLESDGVELRRPQNDLMAESVAVHERRLPELRRWVSADSFRLDLSLAAAAVLLNQLWVARADLGWPYAPVWLQLAVVLAPLLLIVRWVEPVLAAAGLAIAFASAMLLGDVNWVLMAACAVALVSVAVSSRLFPAIITTVLVVFVMPWVATDHHRSMVNDLYPDILQVQQNPGGGSTSSGRVPVEVVDAIGDKSWPVWTAVVLGLAALVGFWLRWRGVSRSPGTSGQRLDELKAAFRHPENRLAIDIVGAVLACALVLLNIRRGQAEGNWWSAPTWMVYFIAYAPITLVLRRVRPLVPCLFLVTAALLAYWQTHELWSVLLAFGVALYSLAAERTARLSLPVSAALLIAAPVTAALASKPLLLFLYPDRGLADNIVLDGGGVIVNPELDAFMERQWPVSLSLILALPVCLGILARLYHRTLQSSDRAAELERRAIEQDALQVLLSERSQVARDLHDVVAHHVNLMVVLAEGGPDLLGRGDSDVLTGFRRIGDSGRRALGELDRMLSALRDNDGRPDPALAPQPGLSEVSRLVAEVSHRGLAVELEQHGDLDRPPAGHRLTAYRIVQEALTNVVRHAEAAGATVVIEVRDDAIAVRVTDDGRGFDPDEQHGRHGLIGMHERVRILGGVLAIDSAPGAGTTVSARLPLPKRAGVG
jgi:signal transduction histidine kinase